MPKEEIAQSSSVESSPVNRYTLKYFKVRLLQGVYNHCQPAIIIYWTELVNWSTENIDYWNNILLFAHVSVIFAEPIIRDITTH